MIKYNILFIPDREKDKPDAKLRMRIRWNGNTVAFNLGYRVNPDKWSNESQRCKNSSTHGKKKVPASAINREIQRFSDLAEQTFAYLEQSNPKFTPSDFRNEFNARNGKTVKTTNKSIFEYYDDFIFEESKLNSWTYATIQKHRTMKRHLQNFAPHLEYSDINIDGLNQFVSYLLSIQVGDSSMRNTTVKKDVKIVKWFLRWSHRKGLLKDSSFLTFSPRLKTIPKKVIFLEWDELMKIFNTEILPQKAYLNRVRDKFLFCCFTSLRYSDMEALTWDNVHQDYIEVVTVKTNDPIKIELNRYSKEIIAKQSRDKEKVFFPISNQKMNVYLKELCQLCGIDAPVTTSHYCGSQRIDETTPKYNLITTHAGRRTFICNALMLGIAPSIVMKWTGHSDYDSMKPYIEIADRAKQEAMHLFDK